MKNVFIMMIVLLAAALGIIFLAFGPNTKSPSENNQPPGNSQQNFKHTITIKTSMGEIKFATYDADTPKAVNNFITLAQNGFYDGVIFHRVIDGFMIQGGRPPGQRPGRPRLCF